MASSRIGASAGFTLRKLGGVVISAGSWRWARRSAACTSSAAASMLRSSLNWMVICVVPWPLIELIWSMPSIAPNCFSRGSATEFAMVSGLAPGSVPVTTMVGKSTRGRAATGSWK